MEGSYEVEYNDFEKIYRFMERNLIREHREVQCVLFTLDDYTETDEIVLQEQLAYLQHAVVSSLRKRGCDDEVQLIAGISVTDGCEQGQCRSGGQQDSWKIPQGGGQEGNACYL